MEEPEHPQPIYLRLNQRKDPWPEKKENEGGNPTESDPQHNAGTEQGCGKNRPNDPVVHNESTA